MERSKVGTEKKGPTAYKSQNTIMMNIIWYLIRYGKSPKKLNYKKQNGLK